MRTDTPKTIYLKDYKPYPFAIESLGLHFDIYDGHTFVTAVSKVRRLDKSAKQMVLNGEALELVSLKIDGKEYKDYTKDEIALTINNVADSFRLEIVTKITPETNTRLEGLYMSGGNYCTQCEAEGFRRITYYPDRPDVLSIFTVRVEADAKFPVLLSNGNKTEEGKAKNGRHFTVWEDPFPKPCYLFALVAGDLTHIHDIFKTKSGRMVDLYIYVRPGDEGQCSWAMDSLKRSMDWDEKVYGLEYDLNIFNIVAVSDFNMGAMENKSLNIFNTALVLAHQETATDSDFMRVESVIAHEYFHNWSGNRVTCRDWFQLSLKEGLTVFRDQEFSADLHSRAVQRIDDVTHLRRFQFPEDSGPLSHPIRPDNYIEINNFYTMTVYEKGAEVIRMLRTVLGEHNYRKGTDLYFARHDGQAVTCDDFVQCLQEASGIDLSQFRLWYSQAGTPDLYFTGDYDEEAQVYNITLKQKLKDGQKPMLMPVSIGLVAHNGRDLIGTETLLLKNEEQSFTFKNIHAKPVPSVLRNFSAPVTLKSDVSDSDLSFLMVHDTDGFNRWEAGQTYMLRTLNHMIDNGSSAPDEFLKQYKSLLEAALEKDADRAFMARAISLPDVPLISLTRDVLDPPAIYKTRSGLLDVIADKFSKQLDEIYRHNRTGVKFSVTAEDMGRRVLQNTAMLIAANRLTKDDEARAREHYKTANNMTDRMAALYLACALGLDDILADFYKRFKDYPLVIDKWFAAQAQIPMPTTLTNVHSLKRHPDFNIKNPNRVRSLYSAFAMNNPVCFHAADGSGYEFLANAVYELNSINPQIAARLLTPLREWKRYTPDRQEKMKGVLEEILRVPKIAPDVFEIASKSLKG